VNSGTTGPQSLRVFYLTMQFPHRNETFAGTEIRALRGEGADVSVHSFLGAHVPSMDVLPDWGLNDVRLTHGSWRAGLSGIRSGLRRPRLLVALISWIVTNGWRRPVELAKTLALVPRALDIFRAVDEEKPDVVHLFWGHFPSLVGYMVKRELPGVIVSLFLGAYDLRQNYFGSRAIARQADVVWTHAEANRPALRMMGRADEDIRINLRGVDLERLAGVLATASGDKDPHRIVTVGRLVPAKGMDRVLEAFAIISNSWAHARLVVVGDGPERKRLEELAAELDIERRVDFRGHLDHDDVIREMAAASVFLYLSEVDRLPNVVKEAMFARCLCVVAHTKGIEELLEHGVHGFVVPPGDVGLAASYVEEAFRSVATGQTMVEAAAVHLAQHFDVRLSAKRLCSEWRMLMRSRRERARILH
jgi:colanic acid/amylovoran biosynthesis glycosyltransferase